MGTRGGKERRKEDEARGTRSYPSPSTFAPFGEALPDRRIVLESIDSGLVGTAELDALERYFGDIVVQALSK